MTQLAHATCRRSYTVPCLLAAVAALTMATWGAPANAEPYIAVQQGLACGQCHVNPTGGGMRNVVGNAFAQNVLPANHVDTGDLVWTGALNNYIAMGGNFRAAATWSNATKANDTFNTEQARIYLAVSPIPDRLLLYIDEQVAPGVASNSEGWVMYRFDANRWYLRAGQMYLPYGLRLQDQKAFVRQVAGINMDSPDDGIELGYRAGPWDAQLAVSNGNGLTGGADGDNGKRYTAQAVHIQNRWRVGVGGSYNDSSTQRSTAGSLFGGLQTGPVSWLAEADLVNIQDSHRIEHQLAAALLEADWLVRRGANLKLTAEALDPERGQGGSLRTRFSVVGEYTPMQYLQLRLGARWTDDHSQQYQAVNQAFLEVHVYF
jgi:hypothetical protein